MLKIRLSRTGKKAQPSYKVVVQEHTSPIKGKFIEEIGFYRIAEDPKVFSVDLERVKHWISMGAQPSDTVASLLKKEGMEGMDKYIGSRDLQRKKKKEQPEPKAEAPKTEEAPKEADAEPQSSPEEAKKEDVVSEEPAEAPKEADAEPQGSPEEAPAEEPAKEEEKSEQE